ncbi:hypothetical protein [Phaeobacter phage MD18]|nr:hypothetical protein [Phaeobacter phage MD18]
MRLFDSGHQDETLMGPFILSEIRDLRKGMEGRDGELRGEIAAVRDAVATLSESVSRSHSKVENIQTDMDAMANDVHKLRKDVDAIQSNRDVERIKQGSAWDGPKRILGVIVTLGAAAGAITAIVKFWPLIVAL